MQPDQLRAIRKELGLNQTAMSKVLGVSLRHLGDMELGKANIEPRTEIAASWVAMGGHEPLRVGVSTFGDQFVVVVTEAHLSQPGRITKVLQPAFSTRDAAEAEAKAFAQKNGCPFVPQI